MPTRIATRALTSISVLVGLSGAASAAVANGPVTPEPPAPRVIIIGSCPVKAYAASEDAMRGALGLDPRPTAFIPILAF